MKTSIIIPMHNEEEGAGLILEKLIDEIRKWQDEYEIIVVDDNSTDKTPQILEEYANKYNLISPVTKRDGSRGMGAALLEGMKKAEGDVIAWVMGDLSDDLGKIPEMVSKIGDGYDIVFASRYMKGGSSGDLGKLKAFLSSRFTVFAEIFFGVGVHDITNAFRAFKKELAEKIKLESTDFAISPELAIKAHILGYRLTEVPCSYKTRTSGKTKFKIVKMVLKYLTLLKYKFYKKQDLMR
ncbi:MAG: glycosyltransferase [Candidatus Omnitrophota bacterium]|nr:MAG: glycosyltransferase [Candidatus Omnitrophota bacterium]